MGYTRSRVTALTAAMVLVVSALAYLALAGRPAEIGPRATGVAPACGDTLSSGDFFLTADIGPCSTDPALTVQSARLNMRGHIVRGDDSATPGDGIVLNGTGAVLENGTVRDATDGVQVEGDGSHIVRRVTIKSNAGHGFAVLSPDNILRRNVATGAGGSGFHIAASGNLVTANEASRNVQHGFVISDTDANKLWKNSATLNGDDGYNTNAGATANTYVANTATSNEGRGFDMSGSDNVFLTNRATRNKGEGFEISGTNNVLGSNKALENKLSGIFLTSTSDANEVVANVAKDNKQTDLRDNNDACLSNRWEGNKGNADPACTGAPSGPDPAATLATPACGDTLPPGSYFLAADVGPCSTSPALSLDSARLDMRGHVVRGNDSQDAIHLDGVGAVLENGVVRDGLIGVQVQGNEHVVRKVTSRSNVGTGFYSDAEATIFRSNVSTANGDDGFRIDSAGGNLLTANTATKNTDNGFVLENANDNGLWNNISTGNAHDGFFLDEDALINTLVGNRASGNLDGFDVAGDESALFNNTASKNAGGGESGFDVEGDNNDIGGNKAIENKGDGFALGGTAAGNDLVTNVARDNRQGDLRDFVDACVSNRWEGNKGKKKSPPCVGS